MMRQTKSYMLPKLICVNMLALMMITFEHEGPADNNRLLKTAKVNEPVPPSQAALIQVAASPAVVTEPQKTEVIEKPVVLKKQAVYKKRMHHSHAIRGAQPMFIKAGYIANSAVDCCFRGSRT